MNLTELQAAITQLSADDLDAFTVWFGGYQATQREEGYDEWFQARIDAALDDQRPTYSQEEVRQHFEPSYGDRQDLLDC